MGRALRQRGIGGPRRGVARVVGWCAVVLVGAGAALGQNPFELAGRPGTTTEVWVGDVREGGEREPAMLRRVAGLLGAADANEAKALRASVDRRAPGDSRAGARPVCTIRMRGKAGSATVDVVQLTDGQYIAAEVSAEEPEPKAWRLKREAFDRVLEAMGPYCGGFGEAVERPGEVFQAVQPLVTGAFSLDSKTLNERVQGGKIIYTPSKRKLEDETLHVRLPRGYSARRRAGLLVWMDPTPGGKPAWMLHEACDELNLVCIGPGNAGNDRPVVDRLQLAMDAAATALRRWHIDQERVYLVGFSGGGKMSSILLAGFPEVFAGAAAVVGLSWYESIPTGERSQVWPPEFIKPTGKRMDLFRRRRLAAVTGEKDYNFKAICAGVRLYERDKLPVRLFDVPGLGHEMPGAGTISEVVRWLDEPAAARAAEAERAAEKALETAGVDERALEQVIAKHAWTGAAWDALDQLSARRGR